MGYLEFKLKENKVFFSHIRDYSDILSLVVSG